MKEVLRIPGGSVHPRQMQKCLHGSVFGIFEEQQDGHWMEQRPARGN